MIWNAAIAVAALLLARPGEGSEQPEVIRLKVGTEIVGVVVDDGFDEAKGVRVRRVDDQSLLDIGFDQMLADDALRIRQAHGYLPDEVEPLLVDATKVTLSNGSTLVGVIVEQGPDSFNFKQGTKVWPIKRTSARKIEPVKIDALEVYDGEELYAEQLAARNPQTALDHYNLALYCESLQLWARAKEHLAQVQALDPAFKAEIVSSKMKRADLRLESSEESDLLTRIIRTSKREQYDDSLKMLDTFLKEKPNCHLRAEFEKERRLLVKQRAKWLRGQSIYTFFTYLERFAHQVAISPKVEVGEARKRMENEATTFALDSSTKWLKAAPDEVKNVWEAKDRPTASPRFVSYGAGTFTLGLENALKGLQKEEEKKKDDKQAGAAPAKDQSLEDRIKDMLEKRKKEQEQREKDAAAKKGQKAPKKKQIAPPAVADVPPTADEWWAQASADERAQYLLAYWAEHDPHVQIIRIDSRPCATCAMEGYLRYFDRNGETKQSPCPRCKTLTVDRIVRYK